MIAVAPLVLTVTAVAAEQGAEEYLKMVERIKGLSAVVDLFVIAEDGYVGVEALLPLVQVRTARAHNHPCIIPHALSPPSPPRTPSL